MGTLLSDDGFRIALVCALVGTGLVASFSSRGVRMLPSAAVTVVATLIGLQADHHLTFSLVLGVTLLALACWATRASGGLVIGAVALVAGALFVIRATPDRVPNWVEILVVLALLPLVPLVELRARRWNRLAPLVVFGAVAAVYACVPDTEFVRPLLAASAPVALLVILPQGGIVSVATGVVGGLLVWTVGVGGYGRPGSVIGGLGVVAALAFFPAWPDARTGGRPDVRWWVRVGVTVALVVWCARVAGFVHSAWLAALLAALGFAVAVPIVLVVAGGARLRLLRRRRPS